jgi:hypothetical protein
VATVRTERRYHVLEKPPKQTEQRNSRRLGSAGETRRLARAWLPLAQAAGARHITRAVASSPMRRLRKTGALDQDGNLVTIPRLPAVTGANKPPGWNRWSPAEKAEHLLGLSLDRMHEYLSCLPRTSIHTGLQRRRRSSASLRWSRPRWAGKPPASTTGSASSKSSRDAKVSGLSQP